MPRARPCRHQYPRPAPDRLRECSHAPPDRDTRRARARKHRSAHECGRHPGQESPPPSCATHGRRPPPADRAAAPARTAHVLGPERRPRPRSRPGSSPEPGARRNAIAYPARSECCPACVHAGPGTGGTDEKRGESLLLQDSLPGSCGATSCPAGDPVPAAAGAHSENHRATATTHLR